MNQQQIREILCANMFDGEDGGMVTMKVSTLLDDASDILAEHLLTETNLLRSALRNEYRWWSEELVNTTGDGVTRAENRMKAINNVLKEGP